MKRSFTVKMRTAALALLACLVITGCGSKTVPGEDRR